MVVWVHVQLDSYSWMVYVAVAFIYNKATFIAAVDKRI